MSGISYNKKKRKKPRLRKRFYEATGDERHHKLPHYQSEVEIAGVSTLVQVAWCNFMKHCHVPNPTWKSHEQKISCKYPPCQRWCNKVEDCLVPRLRQNCTCNHSLTDGKTSWNVTYTKSGENHTCSLTGTSDAILCRKCCHALKAQRKSHS